MITTSKLSNLKQERFFSATTSLFAMVCGLFLATGGCVVPGVIIVILGVSPLWMCVSLHKKIRKAEKERIQ